MKGQTVRQTDTVDRDRFLDGKERANKMYGEISRWKEIEIAWPAKFRETKFCETFHEIFISHFAKFLNYFREIS
jgi:hypothetical protein